MNGDTFRDSDHKRIVFPNQKFTNHTIQYEFKIKTDFNVTEPSTHEFSGAIRRNGHR